MKTLLISTSLILGMSPLAHAAPEEGQFAVLKTEQSCDIKVPTGSKLNKAQVYFSKDCSTAFVLPGENMQGELAEPIYLAGSDDNICNAFYEQNKVRGSYQERVNALNIKIDSVASQRPKSEEDRKNLAFQLRELKKQVAYYQSQITSLMSSYDNMAALRLHYSLSSNQMDAVLAFQTANMTEPAKEGSLYPVRFMPAQLEEGVLAISNPDALIYPGRAVIKANFPGYSLDIRDKNAKDPNTTYVRMNGAISGIVDISASAYCSNKAKNQTDAQIIGRSVALNYNYNVKVQAGKKLFVNASIQTKDFLKQISKGIVTGKFERREFTEGIIAGGLMNSVTISLDDKGAKTYGLTDLVMGKHDQDDASPLALLVSKVLSNYVDHAEAKLEQLGVFVNDPDSKPREVAAGTEDQVAGTRRVCHSNSGFFGIGASSSCSTQPIIVKVDRQGISTMADNIEDTSYIQEQIIFESNETTSVPKSSLFYF